MSDGPNNTYTCETAMDKKQHLTQITKTKSIHKDMKRNVEVDDVSSLSIDPEPFCGFSKIYKKMVSVKMCKAHDKWKEWLADRQETITSCKGVTHKTCSSFLNG